MSKAARLDALPLDNLPRIPYMRGMRIARSGGLLLAAGLAIVLVATAAEAREADPRGAKEYLASALQRDRRARTISARRPGCRRRGHESAPGAPTWLPRWTRSGRLSSRLTDSSDSAPADRCGRRQGPCPRRPGRRVGASRQGGARPGGESRAAARRRFRSAGRDRAADPVPGLRRVRHGARPEWPLSGRAGRREPDPALPVSRGGNGSCRLPAASGEPAARHRLRSGRRAVRRSDRIDLRR